MKTSGSGGPDSFAGVLRAAIADRGVTLVWLRDRLVAQGNPVSLTTLSYWRSGRRHPEGAGSYAAIAAIEDLLGLPVGDLVSQVQPSKRVGPLPQPEVPLDDEAVREAIEETLRTLDAAPLTVLREMSTHVVAEVDDRGRLHRRSTRILVQVTKGTIREIPWIEVAPAPTASVPRLSQPVGAQVARSHRHPGGQVNGFVLELERSVTAPGTALLEFVTELDPDYPPEDEVAYFLTRPAREVLIWVHFDRGRLPVRCESRVGEEEPVPLDIGTGRSVQVTRSGFGPGVLTLRWGF